MYTVSEVARVAGVTVRTLHHYDAIGLLEPSGRSSSGYRQYSPADLERLQEILFYRELGFGLDAVAGLLHTAARNRGEILQEQRHLLIERIRKLEAIVAAVDRATQAHGEGRTMDKEEMFEVFGDFDPAAYEDETRERWGDTDAYRESARRTSRYGKDDWKRIHEQGEAINRRLADLFGEGGSPSGDEAMEAAEEHRLHIDRWFYPCPPTTHAGLGEMYVTDPRFTRFWEDYRPGLTVFVRDAFRANARQSG
jgi:DNA-binding transcriptional MerR regulator